MKLLLTDIIGMDGLVSLRQVRKRMARSRLAGWVRLVVSGLRELEYGPAG